MHLGGLVSTQEARAALGDSYASFVLSNLRRASITPWLHATHLPFLKFVLFSPCATPIPNPLKNVRYVEKTS